MGIKSGKKIFLIIGLTIILLWPQAAIFAVTKSHIGDVCVNDATNDDCEIGGADLDCESTDKENDAGKKYCDCAKDADCDAEYGVPSKGKWECSDGAAYTYDIDYCYNATTREVRTPIGINKDASPISKLTDAIFDAPATQARLMEEVKTFKPGLEIRLPGLTFSDLGKNIDSEGYLHIPWIGEFIRAVYNFGLVIISIVAVVMIIMQGAKIVVSGGESKVEGYKKIGQVAVGLVIAWGSFAILYTINPALVEFQSLRVKYIVPLAMPDYAEGDKSFDVGIDPSYLTGKKPTAQESCLMDKFGLKIGELPPVKYIKLLNLGNIQVNEFSYDAWKKTSDDILASSDPEVKGYLQYMADIKAKKIYDLAGVKDGDGVVSQLIGKVGISRHDGTPLGKITYDMHVTGLAVDFMTRSNWDFNWGGTKKGDPAEKWCQTYRTNFLRMKKDLPDDPYKMYARLEKNINDCFNKFDNGNNPFTSMPQEFVAIFERNGIYWAGHAWGNKMRTDAMHFEYYGSCATIN